MTQQNPSRQAASRGEIEAAIRGMSTADNVRIDKYARLKAAQVGCEPAELVQEAMSAILDPDRRQWFKDEVTFPRMVTEAIRSMASSWAKQRKRRPDGVVLEQGVTDPIEQARSREPNPAQAVVHQDMLAQIRTAFSEDELVTNIIDGLGDEMSRAEIIEVLEIDEQRYDTAARRLRRRAEAMFPKGDR